MGLEPMTLRLKVWCSADWANRALDCSWAVGVFLFRLLYSPLWKALAKSTWEQIDRNMSIYLFIYCILLGRIYNCPERKGTRGLQRPIQGAPPHPPPICIRKTATAPGSPYSFRIVRGFFYVPQNYQHSRNCETGPPAYRPYPRRLESLTICRWNYKGSTFSSVI